MSQPQSLSKGFIIPVCDESLSRGLHQALVPFQVLLQGGEARFSKLGKDQTITAIGTICGAVVGDWLGRKSRN